LYFRFLWHKNTPFMMNSVCYFTVSHKGSISQAGGCLLFMKTIRTDSALFPISLLLKENPKNDDILLGIIYFVGS
ncbi:hypothetical protein, partial [Acetanaerobacterium elongatum]|uniref:hypothetical protein n=1 Tax=Acetanaerobacterium elongatum TaxID=258515 RepID=UPI0019677B90